jgi:hypothetical protein
LLIMQVLEAPALLWRASSVRKTRGRTSAIHQPPAVDGVQISSATAHSDRHAQSDRMALGG